MTVPMYQYGWGKICLPNSDQPAYTIYPLEEILTERGIRPNAKKKTLSSPARTTSRSQRKLYTSSEWSTPFSSGQPLRASPLASAIRGNRSSLPCRDATLLMCR
jgi:hypothetical protein